MPVQSAVMTKIPERTVFSGSKSRPFENGLGGRFVDRFNESLECVFNLDVADCVGHVCCGLLRACCALLCLGKDPTGPVSSLSWPSRREALPWCSEEAL